MIPLYDRTGSVAAFLDGSRIMNTRGMGLGWISNGSIYDYHGRHLGWWESDHARGPDGGVMLWKPGASLGVLTPIPRIPPIPPIPAIERIRPIPSFPPLKPMKRPMWSAYRLQPEQ